METPQFYKIPFQEAGGNYDLIVSLSWGATMLPASLITVCENNKIVGSTRFTPRFSAFNLALTKTDKVYQGQIDIAAIKKFKDSNWIKKIIDKNDPEFIFEDHLDSL